MPMCITSSERTNGNKDGVGEVRPFSSTVLQSQTHCGRSRMLVDMVREHDDFKASKLQGLRLVPAPRSFTTADRAILHLEH